MDCKICLNKCMGEGCCSVNMSELDCLLYAGRIYLADLQSKIIANCLWFNRDNVPKFIDEGKIIKEKLFILKQEWEALKKGFRSCLCDKDICKLIDQLRTLIPMDCVNSCRTDQLIING